MKHLPADMSVWQGRVDPEDGERGLRLHQTVTSYTPSCEQGGVVIYGFACDEGVARNKGRQGAALAPDTIRQALANLAWHNAPALYDGGNIVCDDTDLILAQQGLSQHIHQTLLQHNVLVLGGGHETAWASFQGLSSYVSRHTSPTHAPTIGIINFDAHFDLRTPQGISEAGSSGTPFAQIAQLCQQKGWPFHYACLGVSRTSNTQALFDKAAQLGCWVEEDTDMQVAALPALKAKLSEFIQGCDYLYLTLDMDVFPASAAPGVSAPATIGVPVQVIEPLIQSIFSEADRQRVRVPVCDITEVNPHYDRDQQTSRLAARMAWTMLHAASHHIHQQGE
ncbi:MULTISPECIES: formimidoylglutamase [unclassified Salinivibrio]|uniref:formimidoylglutamase n=1 Tax=unclassified Salinivibrio TaxID=2636825 RepID=UPI00128B41C9|nr:MULTISPECIES: formimidoylglutamase [unclassified Salinivibrio]MPS31652.1 formimidoylglutamase [Salinivibrio sp. VYel7]MPX90223.1 formimidoylglutamase [Salinivibrio sp. VYel1]MPX93047.1 formimidoylglutamase [Salinivibrio sp. VYel9]MPX95269.1 formimidoylglutamase [Salinivibrio sp. VYel6]MPX99265.1 formimidoylglutamase [Salinivibrio sp. VYel4]